MNFIPIYEHNYIKVVQLLPPVTKMVRPNRISSSFYHFAYWKLLTDDKKCLVYRGGRNEGQFIRVYNQVQSWDNDCWSNKVIEEWHGLIKDRCPTKAWLVLHGLLTWSNEVIENGLVSSKTDTPLKQNKLHENRVTTLQLMANSRTSAELKNCKLKNPSLFIWASSSISRKQEVMAFEPLHHICPRPTRS